MTVVDMFSAGGYACSSPAANYSSSTTTRHGLRNKDDPFDKLVFDPAVRGRTDRHVHLYEVK